MVENTIRLDLNKGTVRRDIAEFPEKMLDGAFEAVMQAVRFMVGLAF